ncbi:RNA-binding S4 domain-containing protein [Frigidibacter sp. MR17.14]|uniref:RNA-binding S4 domain-containing protein n=1 Tax=Frigidibacter sp. MR17.14 TaxID=3126509 RepID=UPI003012D988
MAGEDQDAVRLDKWLFFARFCKTRSVSVALIEGGKVRLNGTRVTKPGHVLRPGDTLTLALPGQVRVVRVASCGARRGPATEAQALYDDLEAAPRGE